MNTNIARNLVRYIALPVVSAGILGGAALGLAGIANAGTVTYDPQPRPGIVAVPHTKAHPQVVLVPSRELASPPSPASSASVGTGRHAAELTGRSTHPEALPDVVAGRASSCTVRTED